ncbi:unnamed protein product [Knipowitschia caucasica]|uniref:Uncharacterized protein n=1 Tax=Knipowitschia caucasica TaxID=637954 RepID=A0AAV2LTW4_KNICA
MICAISLICGQRPRIIFTESDTTIIKRRLPAAPVKTLIEGEDVVTAVGITRISLMNFLSPHMAPVELPVEWNECTQDTCIYNLTVIHKKHGTNQLFACGNHGKDVACCNLNISEHFVKCTPNIKNNINEHIQDFQIEAGVASAFVDSPDGGLYIAYAGSQDFVGIHRFGQEHMRPALRDIEQHYIELLVSQQDHVHDVPQDKLYGFYNEKKKDSDMYSHMWKPFVTQLCLVDSGGPKNNLQFTWTSQLNAPLFCGDKDQKLHFSELLGVATVKADHWHDTRLYALFKNQWGMRAVCVFTMKDIDFIFKTSPFKNSDKQPDRPRMCVADSTRLRIETLKQIEANSEMEKCVEPMNSSGPLLSSHHHYTHITAHSLNGNHTLLFIALQNGTVHKVMHKQNGKDDITFVIAEYRPFNHRAHVVSLDLSLSAEKLYVTSQTELAQVDVVNCAAYGDSCEQCVLARDPHCGWSDDGCTKDGPVQDTEHGDFSICPSFTSELKISEDEESEDAIVQILLPLQSRYFFECPVSSLHAHYTWYHDNSPVSCMGEERQCLLLLPQVAAEQAGTYVCVSEEQGYSRVLAEYHLRVENTAAACTTGVLLWVTLASALLVQS